MLVRSDLECVAKMHLIDPVEEGGEAWSGKEENFYPGRVERGLGGVGKEG